MSVNKISKKNRLLKMKKKSWGEKLFDIALFCILSAFILAVIYPIWFVVIASVSNADAVTAGRVIFWPVGFELEGYKRVFQNADIWLGYANTILYTAAGTFLSVMVTVMAGYALSRKDLVGRTFFVVFLLGPM